jgi:hypothetical protein
MAPLCASAASCPRDILNTVVATLKPESELAKRSTEHVLHQRGLSVNHTQAVTLGVIAAYIVAIAILWNIPFLRWSLWPFKVSIYRWYPISTGHWLTVSLQ